MGFFQKMQVSDIFVILDNVKYRKNYFQNRNKFLNKSGGEEWFTIPVEKKATRKLIKDVKVSGDVNWRRKIITKLKQNFGIDMSDVYQSSNLLEINMASIRWCMKNLDIEKPMVLASELGVSGNKSQLLANIVRQVGGTEYISGPSGRDYLELDRFGDVQVSFFEPKVENYYSTLYNICKEGRVRCLDV